MSAALPSKRLLLGLAALIYVAVTVGLVFFERPGYGVGHFFYVGIALAALALGPVWGAAAGTVATGLFSLSVILNHSVPTRDLFTIATPIRLVTFVSMGVMLGWFATHYRKALEELRVLAERDSVTDLPNTRSFEQAVDRRLASGEPFALLLGDVDDFRLTQELGRTAADDTLRRIGVELLRIVDAGDEVARVGEHEFAILSSARSLEDAGRLAARLERRLVDAGARMTFGWSASPQEGANALSLYRAADERLYARRLLRDPRPRDVQTART